MTIHSHKRNVLFSSAIKWFVFFWYLLILPVINISFCQRLHDFIISLVLFLKISSYGCFTQSTNLHILLLLNCNELLSSLHYQIEETPRVQFIHSVCKKSKNVHPHPQRIQYGAEENRWGNQTSKTSMNSCQLYDVFLVTRCYLGERSQSRISQASFVCIVNNTANFQAALYNMVS